MNNYLAMFSLITKVSHKVFVKSKKWWDKQKLKPVYKIIKRKKRKKKEMKKEWMNERKKKERKEK